YVCDNGSTDKTVSLLQQYGPRVKVILNSNNEGFGAANNRCIRKAYDEGADYFLLINQDVYLQPDTITMLLQQVVQHEDIGIISPLHYNGNGTAFDKNFLRHIIADSDQSFVNDCHFKKAAPWYFVSYVNAACWLLPGKTIEKVGGFDPLFFHYG